MDPVLHLTLRAAFALLMAASARHKLGDLAHFRGALAAYEILPAASVPIAAAAIAGLELLLAVALASGLMLRMAAALQVLLLLAYAAAIHVNVRRGRTDIDCGCAGPASRTPVGEGLVLRNLVLAAAAGLLLLPAGERVVGLLDGTVVAAAVATLAALWLATERLFAIAPRAAGLRRRMA